MKKYRVLVRGENFLMNLENADRKLGFFTTRFVEAEDSEQAEFAAMETLRADRSLSGQVLNDRSDPPMMYADEIEELESFDGYSAPGTGLAFFESESDPANDAEE
jgi:hypothetical protein